MIFLLQLLGTSPVPVQGFVLQLLEALFVGAVGMTISALISNPVYIFLVVLALASPVLFLAGRRIHTAIHNNKLNAIQVDDGDDANIVGQHPVTAFGGADSTSKTIDEESYAIDIDQLMQSHEYRRRKPEELELKVVDEDNNGEVPSP